jgi:hypothetical protein
MLDIDVVEPDRGLPEQDFAGRGRCDIVQLVTQHRRRPGLRHDDAIGAHDADSYACMIARCYRRRHCIANVWQIIPCGMLNRGEQQCR